MSSTVSSPTGSSMRNISELLSLNIPWGPIEGPSSMWSPPVQPQPTENYQPRHQRSRPPNLPSFSNLDSANNSLDSLAQGHSMPQPEYQYDLTQSQLSPLQMPRAIRGTPPFSDCGSPSLEQTLASPSNSSSNSGSNGSSELLEMMNNLSLSPHGGICSPPTGQELANLRALHTLNNNVALQNVNAQLTSLVDNRQNTSIDNTEALVIASLQYNQGASCINTAMTWRGILPPRFLSDNPSFSCKVFLGGVPLDVTEYILISEFSQFGNVKVEWPGKEQVATKPKGYVYIIFESEKQVKALINNCKTEVSPGNYKNWYYRISSRKLTSKKVQVIPWCLSDSKYLDSQSQKDDPRFTVFVGALHGMINAEGLFKIMNDLFGGVIYAEIDTDKFRYPIGSARVCFNNQWSYFNAVAAAFIEIKTITFVKKAQVEPYLEDSPCSSCWFRKGPYFCRNMKCFRYFCNSCWIVHHPSDFSFSHTLMTRKSKTSTAIPSNMHFFNIKD